MKFLCSFFAFLTLFPAFADQGLIRSSYFSDDEAKALQQNLLAEVQSQNLGGVAVALVFGGEIVYKGAFGFSNVFSQTPFDFESRTSIGSISKVFTTMAIYHLIETVPELTLETSLGEILPETHPNMKSLTIRQLLSHTSGLRRSVAGDSILSFDLNARREYSPSYRELKEVIIKKDQRLFKKPDVMAQYSNLAYSILGLIIREVALSINYPFQSVGISNQISEYVVDNIVKPLNMTENTTLMSPNRDQSKESQVYSGVHKGLGDYRHIWKRVPDLGMAMTHSGVVTDIVGLAKFALEIDQAMVRDSGTRGPVLSGKSYKKWLQLAVRELSEEAKVAMRGNATGALLYERMDVENTPRFLIGHTGTGFGSRAIMFVEPKTGAGVALIINSKTGDRHGIAKIALAALYKAKSFVSKRPMNPEIEQIFDEGVAKLNEKMTLTQKQKDVFPKLERPMTLEDLLTYVQESQSFSQRQLSNMVQSLLESEFVNGAFGSSTQVVFVDSAGRELGDPLVHPHNSVFLKLKANNKLSPLYYTEDVPEGEAPFREGFSDNFVLFAFFTFNFTFHQDGSVSHIFQDNTFYLKARSLNQSLLPIFPQDIISVKKFTGGGNILTSEVPFRYELN